MRLTVARYYTPLGRNIQKPYDKGIEAMKNELMERFHNGEVVHGDTSKPTGQAFKTKAGHIVYGGGGITPDIFIPFDTTSQPKEVLDLYMKGTFNNFVYNYYVQNKSSFQSIKNPAGFYSSYKPGEKEFQQLTAYAMKRDTVDIGNISAAAKADLLQNFQAMLARQIWRTEGYYEVRNETDPMIKEALEVVK